MPSGGGLLQLVATGKQDAFLTGNPQVSFFKSVYRRHTNFAVESQAMFFDGTPNFGQRITCLVPRRGDLLGPMYLEVTLPVVKDMNGRVLSYTNSVGHALIQEISFEVGEQEIDRQTGEWMEIWSQLTTPAGQRAALNEMLGRVEPFNVVDIRPGASSEGLHITIPLQFYFCRNPGMYLPLLALQYAPIRINITFRPLQHLFWVSPQLNPTPTAPWRPACTFQPDPSAKIINVILWGDYIHLDTEERRRFTTNSHEYLIEQTQYTPPYSVGAQQATATIPVEFNHPIKEFLFVVQRDEMINRNEWFNYSNLGIGEAVPTLVEPYINTITAPSRIDLIQSAKLQLDGFDRFPERIPQYFRLTQPYEHHTSTPVNSFIYNYSFALHPEDVQPTGTMNASRIDSIVWQIAMNPVLSNPIMDSWKQRGNCRITIYGRNYNVFRVINGFGGVLYKI
jgi:hypothetical protein